MVKLYKRPVISTILKRLSEDPQRLIIITGPRQSGKTTVLLQALGQIDRPSRYLPVDEPARLISPMLSEVYEESAAASFGDTVSVTDERDARWLVHNWEKARIEADRSERGFVIAFDEIQKIPNWSETVKGLWDADRRNNCPMHVVLLGSAPLVMQSGLTESLAGRFETVRLTHWSFTEMSEAFDIDLPRYIYFGGYPGAAALIDEHARWKQYILETLVEPNIERDILAMQPVRKPALLKRLFELGAAYSGQIFSYSKMLGQLTDAGNTTTLAHYLNLMSRVGLIVGLEKYSERVFRRKASSPKLNVLNTALMSACSGYTYKEARTDRTFWGRLVESTVGAHLFNTAVPDDLSLYYWRDGNLEVDFILRRGPDVIAFEVKSGTRRMNTNGLEEFKKRFNPFRSLLVGEGGIPIEEFLSIPAKNWFENS